MSTGRFGTPSHGRGRVTDTDHIDALAREFGHPVPNRAAINEDVERRARRREELDRAQRAKHGGPDCDHGPSGVVAYDMCQCCKRALAEALENR